VVFVAWAGLRGGDSLVLALSLPLQTASGARFPARDQIIFITFSVIFISLVVQGPTLAPLLRLLGLHAEEGDAAEESHARLAVAEAGLRKLDEPAFASSSHPEVVRYLRQRHRQRARRWAAREAEPHTTTEDIDHHHFVHAPSHEAGALDDDRAAEYRRVRAAMLLVEQDTVLALRDDGVLADDIMRRIQRDLDLETLLLDSREPVSTTASDVPSSSEEGNPTGRGQEP
jgi:CPA1 family monovalent cation:H+ antiporter